jgi:predicted protein tyrosine phosphatase
MPRIHVCPLDELDRVLADARPSHLVSLLSRGTPQNSQGSRAIAHRLEISVSDIAEPLEGHILPDVEHVAPLIAFAQSWPRETPLVVHCWAGISRSTAAAFVIACALAPERDERAIAQALRKASPMATPNRRIIAVADDLLAREGRMVAAIAEIGRGTDAFCGVPFILSLEDES